jgi:hypothetical protein
MFLSVFLKFFRIKKTAEGGLDNDNKNPIALGEKMIIIVIIDMVHCFVFVQLKSPFEKGLFKIYF